MTQADMLSINTVAAKLGLSVHQLRRWELMFGLEIKRGRGQQRQYRSEDLSVLERIKELVEQGWPTSQIRPQLEAEGLITPKLIGVTQQPGNPEMLMEAVIGLRSFSERRFIEISKQIDELRQLMISITLRNELRSEISSPWQPVEDEFGSADGKTKPEEISIGPAINVVMPSGFAPPPGGQGAAKPPAAQIMPEHEDVVAEAGSAAKKQAESPAPAAPASAAVEPAREGSHKFAGHGLEEINDHNFLNVLGKALDMISWTDDQADEYSLEEYGIDHWDELSKEQAERFISFLIEQLDAEGDSNSPKEP